MFNNSAIVTISDKWQVVLPKAVRKHLNLKPKDKIFVKSISDSEISLKIIQDPVKESEGYLARNNPQGITFQDLLKDKYDEIAREE